jgi:hypothetical protein
MGRILDLCAEIASEAEEGEDGLILSPDAWERFRQDWNDEEIDDALALVKDTLLQGELIEASDSLSARLLDVLGNFGSPEAFKAAVDGEGRLSVETLGQLARRVSRLEEVLQVYRDGTPPDRSGFDGLRRQLATYGIEEEMGEDDEPEEN